MCRILYLAGVEEGRAAHPEASRVFQDIRLPAPGGRRRKLPIRSATVKKKRLWIILQISGKILRFDLRQPQDAPKSTDLEFFVERGNRSHFPLRGLFREPHMTPGLSTYGESVFFREDFYHGLV